MFLNLKCSKSTKVFLLCLSFSQATTIKKTIKYWFRLIKQNVHRHFMQFSVLIHIGRVFFNMETIFNRTIPNNLMFYKIIHALEGLTSVAPCANSGNSRRTGLSRYHCSSFYCSSFISWLKPIKVNRLSQISSTCGIMFVSYFKKT